MKIVKDRRSEVGVTGLSRIRLVVTAKPSPPRMSAFLSGLVLAAVLGFGMPVLALEATIPEPIWSQTLERPVAFHNLVDTRILIAATGRHLYGMDPNTGRIRWREHAHCSQNLSTFG